MSIGIMSNSWGREQSLDFLAQKCQQFGLHSLTVESAGWPGLSLDELMAALDGYGLRVNAVHGGSGINRVNTEDEARERQTKILEAIETAHTLGCRIVNTYCGSHPARDSKAEEMAWYTRWMAPCLDRAAQRGVTIALETEFDRVGKELTRTAEATLRLLEAMPGLKLNMDAANVYVAGEEPYPYAYELLKDHIAYLHAKNATKFRPGVHDHLRERIYRSTQGEFVMVPLPEGAVNWRGLASALVRDGYDGDIAIESETILELTDSYHQIGADYLRSLGL